MNRALLGVGLSAALLGTSVPPAAAAAPVLTTVAPTSARPGATVTLSGSELSGTTAVTLGGTAMAFTVVDGSSVTATVPAAATTGAVSVTTPEGTASGPTLTVLQPPAAPVLASRAGNGVVELRWTGGGSAGVIVRALAGSSPPAGTTDGRALTPSGTTALDSGLTNGSTHSYSVWAVDTDGTTSTSPASVTATPGPPAATTLRLAPSVGTVLAGQSVTLNGRLFHNGSGVAVGGALIDVFARQGGTTTVRKIGTVRTRPDGLAFHTLVPRVAQEYQLRYAGDAFSAAAASPKVVIRVQPKINSRFSPSGVLKGQSTAVLGSVYPAYQGARVVLQQQVPVGAGSTFQTVLTMATASDGRFAGRYTPSATATYRVVLLPTAAYNGVTTQPPMTLRVDLRDLRIGNRGADVLAVEQALWSQGKADVGRVDGYFDADTLHGVIAFQKSQGLPRTGVFNGATRTRLGAHTPRPARYPTAGRTAEIDLSQQVLRLFEKGRLARLVDVSSGNNELYQSEGVTYRAFTPVGRFSILRKIDGIRVSHLGELYRPAYFTGGWAVHGSKSVPTYPASHGCVRVTNSQMDRLFPLLTIGTPLAVYTR